MSGYISNIRELNCENCIYATRDSKSQLFCHKYRSKQTTKEESFCGEGEWPCQWVNDDTGFIETGVLARYEAFDRLFGMEPNIFCPSDCVNLLSAKEVLDFIKSRFANEFCSRMDLEGEALFIPTKSLFITDKAIEFSVRIITTNAVGV